jgi:glycosyltransferase involved in cell wall biosynthesis
VFILHLLTSESGGAGLAASRLAAAQAATGIKVLIYSNQTRSAGERYALRKFWIVCKSKLTTATNILMTKKNFPAHSIVSISSIERKRIISLNPEIIHIHNWYNLLSIDDINFLLKNFFVVFTMHDMRLLTGGCHYSLNCARFETSCRNCPQTRTSLDFNSTQKRKIEAIFLANRDRYAIVAPSNWLSDLALKNSIGRNATEVLSIPNVINNQDVSLSSELLARNQTGTRNLLFISHDLASPIKGLDLLLAALSVLAEEYKISFNLTTVGHGFERISVDSKLVVTNIEKCNPGQMKNLMISQDALVVPSRNDNSPNVVLEAQSIGLVVIASEVGGIAELVIENKTGFLFNPNVDSLVQSLLNFHNASNLDVIRKNAREFSQKRSSEKDIVVSHISLYKRLRNEE